MTNIHWQAAVNPTSDTDIWVLDIVASAGSSQMYLVTTFPNDGAALTQAEASGAATAMETAVTALADVTSTTLTEVSVSGWITAYQSAVLLLDSAQWQGWSFTISLPDGGFGLGWTGAYLYTASPADGKLTTADISAVTAALATYFGGLTTVTACSVAQQAVTPTTA